MCGILGIASSESLEINHEFRSALQEINHRGPDFNAIWLSENKKLGGQHKVPRLSNKRDFLEELLKINN